MERALKRDIFPCIFFSCCLLFPIVELKFPLCVLFTFSLISALVREFSSLMGKSAAGIFCQKPFALFFKRRWLKPGTAANKLVAIIVKGCFISLPG